jgi:hypothetical protein
MGVEAAMTRRTAIAAATLLCAVGLRADANIPPVQRLTAAPEAAPTLPPGQAIPLFPDLTPTATLQDKEKGEKGGKPQALKPESRLLLIRYIHGEFARAVRPVPILKQGFRIKAGAPVNETAANNQLIRSATAAGPGDTVQVTRLEFRNKDIWIDLNGGAREKKRWRDRISVSVGGPGTSMPTTRTTTTDQNATPGYQRVGATLVLEFDGPVPDMTPDQFKQYLSAYLDISKARSATVQWFETLAPEFQSAIKEKRAIIGMDREMVVAALGRPEHKVRERDPDGTETEDWIYGHPPTKTIFVKFAGEKVVAVREFPK